MSIILAFDLGKRRTGVAVCDANHGVAIPLVTLEHSSMKDQIAQILEVIRMRKADRIVVGLPRLLSGEEGSQAAFVRTVADAIAKEGIHVEFVDERYSNDPEKRGDPDAYAAWNLLQSLPLHPSLKSKGKS